MSIKMDLDRSRACLINMLDICREKGRILVLMQNNPDPDAIAAALAVRELVHHRLGKSVSIGYGGKLGRSENKAMLHELHVTTRRIQCTTLSSFRTICLVDTQPRFGNNALLRERSADIVIDHHIPAENYQWKARMTDIRVGYGATSTILYEYITAAEMRPSTNLATALYYGIESDTQELGRDTSEADIQAFQQLVGLIDTRKTARIRRAPVPPEYFEMLHGSLANAVVAGTVVISHLNGCRNPDMFGEIADLTMRLNGMRTSVCYGRCGDIIYLSARAVDARSRVDQRIGLVVQNMGSGGGHRCMAGAQVPIGPDPAQTLDEVRKRILRHFAHARNTQYLVPRHQGTKQADVQNQE